MPTISPLIKRTVTDDALYQRNFHEGHGIGLADYRLGKFEQHRAVNDPARPGFGQGYRAGQRLGDMERKRK